MNDAVNSDLNHRRVSSTFHVSKNSVNKWYSMQFTIYILQLGPSTGRAVWKYPTLKMVEILNWGTNSFLLAKLETEGKLKFKLSNFLQFLITKHLLGDFLTVPPPMAQLWIWDLFSKDCCECWAQGSHCSWVVSRCLLASCVNIRASVRL